MINLEHFIYRDGDPTPLLYGSYDPWLVALSVIIAIGTSTLGIQLARVACKQRSSLLKHMSIGAGSISLGAGIWAMHFIGMMALDLCTKVNYDPLITILSMAPGVMASWYALQLLSGDKLTYKRLWLGGTVVGAGIGSMHYMGMLAMQMAPTLKFDLEWVLISVVVAVVLATGALWISLHLNQKQKIAPLYTLVLGGSLMGIAIAAMHYTGMASARVLGVADPSYDAASNYSASLSLGIALVTILIGVIAAAINALIHYKQMLYTLQTNQTRLSTILDTAVDGIITIDMQGHIVSFNHAAEQIFGWTTDEVMGKDTAMLMPKVYSLRHNHFLKHFGENGQAKILGVGREVTGVKKDGTNFPMRLAVGKANIPGEPLIVGFITDLTQRNAMKNAMRERDEQLRSLMANIPGVTFRCHYDQDWSMQLISESVLELTGWEAKVFLENHLSFNAFTHPEDAKRITTEVASALSDGSHYAIEYRIQHRNGQEKWVSEMGCAVRDKAGNVTMLDGVILDITENKLKNAAYESIARAINLSTSMAEYSMDGTFLAANDSFLTLIGYEREEIIGKHHSILCSEQDAASERYHNKWRDLNQGKFVEGEYKRLGKHGREIWIHASYSPLLDADGRPCKVLMFLIDISERIRIENDLKEAKNKAELAASAKATFLANMSHEIRTPMNAIIGFSEIMMDTPMQEEQRRYMSTINGSAKSLLHLLNDILDSAKLEKGKLELETIDFSLHALLDNIISTLWIQARSKNLDLQLEIPADIPMYYRGAPDRIRQVLMNLLGNAIKFTEHGWVKLQVTLDKEGMIVFEVIDTGIGIAKDRLDAIFEPFTQADSSMSRRFGGTGLGTTISKQLVELMGGHISATSEIGIGSKFTMTLPLKSVTLEAVQEEYTASTLPAMQILVADDIRQNLDLISILLGRDGHQITTASNGLEAVKKFQHHTYDLIILDVQMPDLDGLGAAAQIRVIETEKQLKRTPIIALTASVLQEDRLAAFAAGMDGFASKPIDIKALNQEMQRVTQLQCEGFATISNQTATTNQSSPQTAINLEKGISLWGSQTLYLHELTKVAQELPTQLARIKEALSQQNFSELGALAHACKGVSGNLALSELSSHFSQLEKHAHAKDLLNANDTVRLIANAMTRFMSALADMPSSQQTDPVAAKPNAVYDISAMKVLLDALSQAAQQAEIDDTQLQRLAHMALPDDKVAVDRIIEAFNDFEFEQAAEAILQLQTRIIEGAH